MSSQPITPPLSSSSLLSEQPLQAIGRAHQAMARVLRGQDELLRVVLAAVLARGHILLEDVPGVGKTTLARTVAAVLGGSFARIQFTADMLPADVLGVQVFEANTSAFVFKKGPLFAQVVLADEINRASPKTQSAMLEAMGEGHITVDDTTLPLPQPFCVLATQNPLGHHGAYPLPESQLDRFMVRLSLGYPPHVDELDLLTQAPDTRAMPQDPSEVLGPQQVLWLQNHVAAVHLPRSVADYLLRLIEATRQHNDVLLGCSPRASLALASMARAWAFLQGRDFVIPDDIKLLADKVLAHRLLVTHNFGHDRQAGQQVLRHILQALPVPR